jgi:2-polyprenyl-6-hydroxyphenyl methylase/3-demethylubiquinone-9 3-methyltransferase
MASAQFMTVSMGLAEPPLLRGPFAAMVIVGNQLPLDFMNVAGEETPRKYLTPFRRTSTQHSVPRIDLLDATEILDPLQENEMASKNTICLWYDGTAMDAARFYAETFPDSAVGAVMRAPGDYPDGKQGDVLTVEFTVAGIPCVGLNGGPAFKHNEAFSFQIATDDQAETDRLWNAIVGNGGEENACGWCKDKWGLSWQITPRALLDAITDPDRAAAKRAFDAMMTMRKIDVAAIEAARRG